MKKKKKTFQSVLDFGSFQRRVEECKYSISGSEFYNRLLTQLKDGVKYLDLENVSNILCYGLGNFTSSVTSRYQLALLLLLQECFQVEIYAYDPIFSQIEIDFLKQFNFTVIDENEEGIREISEPTLIFLPHCPTALVNNLLWRNWSTSLSNCIVLGNSFKTLLERHSERYFKEKYYYIYSILPSTQETQVENIFRFTDIFNDISLHVFPPSKLSQIPTTFWNNKVKPVYTDCDIECIGKKFSETLRI